MLGYVSGGIDHAEREQARGTARLEGNQRMDSGLAEDMKCILTKQRWTVSRRRGRVGRVVVKVLG